jgi:hypothetical protein
MKIISHKGARSLWIVGPPLFNTGLASSCPENGFSPVWGKLMVPQNSFCHELIVAGVTDPENDIYRAERASRHGSFLLVLMSQMSQIRVLNRLLSSVETLVLLQCSSQNKLEFT